MCREKVYTKTCTAPQIQEIEEDLIWPEVKLKGFSRDSINTTWRARTLMCEQCPITIIVCVYSYFTCSHDQKKSFNYSHLEAGNAFPDPCFCNQFFPAVCVMVYLCMLSLFHESSPYFLCDKQPIWIISVVVKMH